MQELNHKLATMVTSRENLERLSYTMRDEINDLANKLDNQSLEVKDVQGALRLQTKMFETQKAKLVSNNCVYCARAIIGCSHNSKVLEGGGH